MHRIRTLRAALVVALTALLAFVAVPASAAAPSLGSPSVTTTRADIGVDSGDNLYIAAGDSATRRLSVHTAAKASGWTDWATRYTSSMEYYSDPLLGHARLLDDVVSLFAPRYGGSRIEVLDWATGEVGGGGRTTDVVNRGSG